MHVWNKKQKKILDTTFLHSLRYHCKQMKMMPFRDAKLKQKLKQTNSTFSKSSFIVSCINCNNYLMQFGADA